MKFEAHGVTFDITPGEISGPPTPGRFWTRAILRRLFFGLPALGLIVVVLLVPLGVTVAWALGALRDGGPLHLGPGFGWTYLRTLLSIGFAGFLVLAGFAIARFTRRVERLWRLSWMVLILPFGASALVSGAAFRIMFDPEAGRSTISGLTGLAGFSPDWLWEGWIWIVLASAFTWTWLGFIVSLFRAGLEAVERDPIASRRLTESSSWRNALKLTRPVAFVVGLTVTVAAARVFDLILIAAPGSVQYGVDVVGVRWWRLTEAAAGRGQIALYVLPLMVVLAVVVPVFAYRWLAGDRDQGPAGRPERPLDIEIGARARRGHLALGLFGTLLAAYPALTLLATAFHSPGHAGTRRWWAPEVPSGENFVQAANAGLVRSLGTTVVVATSATLLLVGAALPVAYWLAARPTSGWRRTTAVVLVGLAVMPVQAYIAPLREASDRTGLGATTLPLILVHAAAGLPFAVLVLRGALYAQERTPAHDALFGLTGPRTTARRIWAQAGPALIAVTVLEFVQVWNDFIISFLIAGPGTSPLTLVLWGEARQFGISSGTVAASAVVSAIIPVTLLLLTWRRFVVPGITGGVLR